MKAVFVMLFHSAALGLYAYVSYQLQFHLMNQSSTDPVIGQMRQFKRRFLTNWTYTVQMVYFFLCVIAHLLSVVPFLKKIKEKVDSLSNHIFTTIATPVALMVSIVFWAVFAIDRELIYPKGLDKIIPIWINHSIHTFNSALAIIDMYLVHHSYPSWGSAIKSIFAYLLCYAVCLFGTYYETDKWIYPLLHEMTWPQRIIFSVVVFIIPVVLFGLTKAINSMLWGSSGPEKSKKNKKMKKKSSVPNL